MLVLAFVLRPYKLCWCCYHYRGIYSLHQLHVRYWAGTVLEKAHLLPIPFKLQRMVRTCVHIRLVDVHARYTSQNTLFVAYYCRSIGNYLCTATCYAAQTSGRRTGTVCVLIVGGCCKFGEAVRACSLVPSLPRPSFFAAVEKNGAGKPGRNHDMSRATNVTQFAGTTVNYPQIAYNLSMLAKSYLHRLIVALPAKDG